MTQAEILEKVTAGREKARQRRGISERLGIRRTREIKRTVVEEVVVSEPKTPEEIQQSILDSQAAAEAKRFSQAEAKKEAKSVVDRINELGFRLDYDITPFRVISIAYKWDSQTSRLTIYFSVLSKKDSFSRPAARAALLKHIEAGTHEIQARTDLPDRKSIQEALAKGIQDRIVTHPHEFPSEMVKFFHKWTSDPSLRDELRMQQETCYDCFFCSKTV